MKQLKIASLGTDNKTAYDSKGERYFVPERFRKTIKAGDYMLVATKHFEQSADRNADGSVKTNADGSVVLIDKPFDRNEITMIGDFRATTLALHEDKVLEGVGEAIVVGEIKKLKAEAGVSEKDVLDAIGA